LYNTSSYTPHSDKNSLGVTGFLNQSANHQDLQVVRHHDLSSNSVLNIAGLHGTFCPRGRQRHFRYCPN
jgi:hypothetical protein